MIAVICDRVRPTGGETPFEGQCEGLLEGAIYISLDLDDCCAFLAALCLAIIQIFWSEYLFAFSLILSEVSERVAFFQFVFELTGRGFLIIGRGIDFFRVY